MQKIHPKWVKDEQDAHYFYTMRVIGVFCGGYSSEFNISKSSALTIIDNFPKGYTPMQIVVQRENWLCYLNNRTGKFDLNSASAIFEEEKVSLFAGIVYIHGDPGENGKLQSYLDFFNIPCINSDYLASALSFDKWYCNQFLKSFEIPVAKSVLLLGNTPYRVADIVAELGLPIFVKPTNSGSSFGISKVKERTQIPEAIALASKESASIVLEAFLDGMEVTCGVYRTKDGLQALPLTEIVSENEYFDYEAKYQGKSQEITPARVETEIAEQVQSLAKKVYKLLNLRSIARIDFIIVQGTPFVIEVNTTPGFSKESIVPKMLQEARIPIREFWTSIFEVELLRDKSIK